MVNRNLDVAFLRSFILAEKLGSFSAAARALNCTQAALSLRIRKLEELLDAPLFVRNYHKLVLTPVGQAILEDAKSVVKQHDKLIGKARDRKGREVLTCGVPEDFARPFFKEFMSRRTSDDNGLDVEITMRLSRELIQMVKSGRLNMAVTSKPQDEDGGEVLFERDLLWIASPGFQWDIEQPIPLCLHPEGCIYRERILQVLEAVGMPYRIVFNAQSTASVQAAVVSGMGFTAIAEGMVPTELENVSDHANLPQLGRTEMRLFRHPNLSEKGNDFVESMKATFRDNQNRKPSNLI